MIEQYPIATTPKYNFPQATMDTTLPHQFIELSLHSLKHAPDHAFQLNQQNVQQFNSLDIHEETLRLKLEPLPLIPSRKGKIVAAVDTSTIKIGETSTGIVIAVRGANVWKQDRRYRYLRFGPFIFHVTEENKKQVYETLEATYFNSLHEHSHQGAPSILQMPTRIASLLERWLQTMATKTMNNGLALFDGSLTAGTAETPTHRMKEILDTARKGDNVVLAFSKMTNLRANGHRITDLLPDHRPPFLLETEGLRLKPPMVLLGDVYVARLTKGNLAFRLDIDKEVPPERRIEAVEKLLGNDLFTESYPETLRLAHILCTFTANEVLAMQHFVTRKFGLQIINRLDMHRLLFGVFGKGESFS
ncbi:MAG TPA: DNA double-strand break repair nuclease NurA [candidate division Zixibacteria bacterium]|nr:DNA double-strand break repair nuclease NurA [candidate division Zixibacteria bacterium]